MIDTNVGLVWRVPVAGHAWVSATLMAPPATEATPVRVLVANPGAWRYYHPLRDEPELFRRFAELEFKFTGDMAANEETVRRFADRYGALVFGPMVTVPGHERPTGLSEIRLGTDLPTWLEAQLGLRLAVMAWDALQAGNTAAMEHSSPLATEGDVHTSMVIADDDRRPLPQPLPPERLVDNGTRVCAQLLQLGWSTDPSDYWDEWPNNPVLSWMGHLRQWVNEQLGLHAKPRLRWAPASPDKAPLQMGIVLENLLGGMWWQLAMAIDGELRYERCAECGTWFRVKPRGNRANTRFCRDVCRVKSNRRAHPKRQKRKAAAAR